jgi:two-component system cell cycle response regulator
VKILIADDDPVSRRVLEATLTAAGHEVIGVGDGLEAIRVNGLPDSPRMAIVDWMMPGADGLAGLAAEADDFLRKPCDSGELLARLRSGERVLNLQQRLLDAQGELHHQATHDRLTGLPNRAMAIDQLAREIQRMRRERQPLAVAIADIDRFKSINDAHGHQAGDAVLREAALRMNAVRRPYDFIARYGGEEFLLIFPGADLRSSAIVADRVRKAVAGEPIMLDGVALRITISVGVACTAEAGEDPGPLIHAADNALYRAKSGGRNRVEA